MKNRTKQGVKRLLRLTGKICAAAALSLALALSGVLSALPGIGDAFKPLTAHAASHNLSGNYTLISDTTLKKDSDSTEITLTGTDEFTLTGDTVIDLNGYVLRCLYINGSGCDLKILGTATGSAIDIDSSGKNKCAIEAKNVTIDNVSGTIKSSGDNNQGISASQSISINAGDGGLTVTSTDNSATAILAWSGGGDVTISGKGKVIAAGREGIVSSNANVSISGATVTATGNGTGTSEYCGIRATGAVSISGASVTATSGSAAPAIDAWGNISIHDSTVTATAMSATQRPAIGPYNNSSTGNITFSGASTVVTAQNGDTTGTYSAIATTGGTISINAPLGITTPAPPNGVLSTDQKSIRNGAAAANHVVIQNTGGGSGGGGTPTPTPTPTPSPTPTPTEPTWKKLPSTISDGTDRADGDTGLSVTAGSVPDLTITPLPHADGTTAGGFHSLKIGDDFHGPAHFTLDGNVITIHPSILNTLAEGTYIIRINYDNYTYTEAKLMVLGATRPANMTRVTPPQTSDANTPVMTGFGILFLLSLAGMCTIVWHGKRIR